MSEPVTRSEISRELLSHAVTTARGSIDPRTCSVSEYRAARSRALGAIAGVDAKLKLADDLASVEAKYSNKGK